MKLLDSEAELRIVFSVALSHGAAVETGRLSRARLTTFLAACGIDFHLSRTGVSAVLIDTLWAVHSSFPDDGQLLSAPWSGDEASAVHKGASAQPFLDAEGFAEVLRAIMARIALTRSGKLSADDEVLDDELHSAFCEHVVPHVERSLVQPEMSLSLWARHNTWSAVTRAVVGHLLDASFEVLVRPIFEYYASSKTSRGVDGDVRVSADEDAGLAFGRTLQAMGFAAFRCFVHDFDLAKVIDDELALNIFTEANTQDTQGLLSGTIGANLELDEFLDSLIMLSIACFGDETQQYRRHLTVQSKIVAFWEALSAQWQVLSASVSGNGDGDGATTRRCCCRAVVAEAAEFSPTWTGIAAASPAVAAACRHSPRAFAAAVWPPVLNVDRLTSFLVAGVNFFMDSSTAGFPGPSHGHLGVGIGRIGNAADAVPQDPVECVKALIEFEERQQQQQQRQQRQQRNAETGAPQLSIKATSTTQQSNDVRRRQRAMAKRLSNAVAAIAFAHGHDRQLSRHLRGSSSSRRGSVGGPGEDGTRSTAGSLSFPIPHGLSPMLTSPSSIALQHRTIEELAKLAQSPDQRNLLMNAALEAMPRMPAIPTSVTSTDPRAPDANHFIGSMIRSIRSDASATAVPPSATEIAEQLFSDAPGLDVLAREASQRGRQKDRMQLVRMNLDEVPTAAADEATVDERSLTGSSENGAASEGKAPIVSFEDVDDEQIHRSERHYLPQRKVVVIVNGVQCSTRPIRTNRLKVILSPDAIPKDRFNSCYSVVRGDAVPPTVLLQTSVASQSATARHLFRWSYSAVVRRAQCSRVQVAWLDSDPRALCPSAAHGIGAPAENAAAGAGGSAPALALAEKTHAILLEVTPQVIALHPTGEPRRWKAMLTAVSLFERYGARQSAPGDGDLQQGDGAHSPKNGDSEAAATVGLVVHMLRCGFQELVGAFTDVFAGRFFFPAGAACAAQVDVHGLFDAFAAPLPSSTDRAPAADGEGGSRDSSVRLPSWQAWATSHTRLEIDPCSGRQRVLHSHIADVAADNDRRGSNSEVQASVSSHALTFSAFLNVLLHVSVGRVDRARNGTELVPTCAADALCVLLARLAAVADSPACPNAPAGVSDAAVPTRPRRPRGERRAVVPMDIPETSRVAGRFRNAMRVREHAKSLVPRREQRWQGGGGGGGGATSGTACLTPAPPAPIIGSISSGSGEFGTGAAAIRMQASPNPTPAPPSADSEARRGYLKRVQAELLKGRRTLDQTKVNRSSSSSRHQRLSFSDLHTPQRLLQRRQSQPSELEEKASVESVTAASTGHASDTGDDVALEPTMVDTGSWTSEGGAAPPREQPSRAVQGPSHVLSGVQVVPHHVAMASIDTTRSFFEQVMKKA